MVRRGLWFVGDFGPSGTMVRRGLWSVGDYGPSGTMVRRGLYGSCSAHRLKLGLFG